MATGFARFTERQESSRPSLFGTSRVHFVLDRRKHNRFAEILALSQPPHRAGADAERICAALREATGP